MCKIFRCFVSWKNTKGTKNILSSNKSTNWGDSDGTWQRNTYDASGIRSMIAENDITTEFMTFNGLVLSGYNKDGELTEHYYWILCITEI